MADATAILEATYASLVEVGEDCVLTRTIPNGRGPTTTRTVTVRGRLLNADTDPTLGDELNQTGRRLIISNKEIKEKNWPGPPKDKDKVTIQGMILTVENVRTFTIGGVPVRHEMYIKG